MENTKMKKRKTTPLSRLSLATAWASTGTTSLSMGWTPLGQPVFPHPVVGNALHTSRKGSGAFPPMRMGGMPPVKQTSPTTQSQQPQYQAIPYTWLLWMFQKRFSFALDPGTSAGVSSYYCDMVKNSASRD